MNEDDSRQLLERVAGVLLRCFLLSIALVVFWVAVYWVIGTWAFELHSKWFALSRESYDMVVYCGLGFVKLCAFLFFLTPYVSIKLVLRRDGTTG